jgi:cyclopropane fatty-acyl-phospholipid synthase-like methyltransferase
MFSGRQDDGKDRWPAALSYGYAKTGLSITERNWHLHYAEQLRQWRAALAEHREHETFH